MKQPHGTKSTCSVCQAKPKWYDHPIVLIVFGLFTLLVCAFLGFILGLGFIKMVFG